MKLLHIFFFYCPNEIYYMKWISKVKTLLLLTLKFWDNSYWRPNQELKGWIFSNIDDSTGLECLLLFHIPHTHLLNINGQHIVTNNTSTQFVFFTTLQIYLILLCSYNAWTLNKYWQRTLLITSFVNCGYVTIKKAEPLSIDWSNVTPQHTIKSLSKQWNP